MADLENNNSTMKLEVSHNLREVETPLMEFKTTDTISEIKKIIAKKLSS